MELISSKQNIKIKHIRSLKSKKYRDSSGEYIIEGIHHLGNAIENGAALANICYSPDLLTSEFGNRLIAQAKEMDIPIIATTASVFNALSDKENPVGILGVGKQNIKNISHFSPENQPRLVALVSPQDPGNVGSILRTIDAVGADGLLIIDKSVELHHPTIIRASMGAFFNIPFTKINSDQFWGFAKQENYKVIGTSAKGGENFTQIINTTPSILLMGSEQKGLSENDLNLCDQLISLPMRGKTTSLNLSVATGVLLYAMRSVF